jgi:hypothetical protein
MPGKPPYLALLGYFLALSAALTLFNAPRKMSWQPHAFQDAGANLTIGPLTEAGDRPGIDNGYIYGLLCMLAGRVGCGLFGPSPWVSFAAWVVANLVMAWGMARFAHHARVGWAGLAVLTAGMSLAKDQTFVYILEPCLLIHGLAEQARGRRGHALALATACAFVKPSMASCYGLILLVFILADAGQRAEPRSGFLSRLKPLVPAVLTGSALVILLASLYGVAPLVRSLVPVHAAAIYRENHFGFFFGVGRLFWYFPGVKPGYYVGTNSGFWLAGTIVLIGGAIGALISALRISPDTGPRIDSNTELVLTLASLHAAFICFFFAHQYSYDYYYYLLVMGLAVLASRSRPHAIMVLCLSVASLVGNQVHVRDNIAAWRERRPDAEMLGLWAERWEIDEWHEVRSLIAGRHAALLSITEGAAVMIPDLSPPLIFFLETGELTPRELDRKLTQLASAPLIVEAASVNFLWPSERWPAFRPPIEDCDLIFSGKFYRVYRRSP